MRLYLVRHGETPGNVLGQLDTAFPGPGLTEHGRHQAQALVDQFTETPIDLIGVSILNRTSLTAAPLARARKLEPTKFPGIHEIEAGDLELRTDKESMGVYISTIFDWGNGHLESRIPGGTNGIEFFDRFDRDVNEIANSGAHSAVVFSHGAAIRVWVSARSTNVSYSFGAENRLPNCGIIELEKRNADGWLLRSWNGTPVS